MEAADVRTLDLTAARNGWNLAGLLAMHLGLGVVGLVVSAGASFKYLFCETPHSVSIACTVAGVGWLLTGVAVCWLWGARRRRAWLASVAWLAVTLTVVLTVISVEPAGNCGLGF